VLRKLDEQLNSRRSKKMLKINNTLGIQINKHISIPELTKEDTPAVFLVVMSNLSEMSA